MPPAAGADPSAVAPYIFALMQRNISTPGFVVADHNAPGTPPAPGGFSAPGCVLASPSLGVSAADPASTVVTALRNAGDSMLNAIVYHSNNFELSEQFDQATGYEKSVSNLTWSYAAFLLAVAAR